MKKIIIGLFILFSVSTLSNAKTIIGKVSWAQMEEGVIPIISLDLENGKELYTGYSGKDIEKVNKLHGKLVKAYLDKNGDVKRVEVIKKSKTTKKVKTNLPFIGTKQTKDKRTKITISKNGNMTITSHFKNGYKAHFKGKYTKELIPEDGNMPMHGWKVYKNKVCQGYRDSWDCQKLY